MLKTAIVTGGQKKDVAPMAVLALNIKEICPKLADKLVILHDGISKKDQDLIQGVYPTEFRRFYLDISRRAYRNNPSLRYFSYMVFCKFECFNLLNDYDIVIWTDYDVVINRDLEELKDVTREGLQLIMSEGTLGYKFKENMPKEFLEKYDMVSNAGVSTPLLVMTKAIGDYNEYYKWCMNTAGKYAEYLNMPEESIFSLLVQEYGIKVYPLPKPEYALQYSDDADDAAIHHAIGQPKYWNGLHHRLWAERYDKWVAMGGTPYKQPLKEKLQELLSGIKHMDK